MIWNLFAVAGTVGTVSTGGRACEVMLLQIGLRRMPFTAEGILHR
jgi:hypothetical protein